MKPFLEIPRSWLDRKELFLAGRPTKEIVIHCSATPPSSDWSVQRIDALHRASPRNWNGIGYHFYITKNGKIFVGRPLEKIGAHVKGHNMYTIGVCYEGGVVRQAGKLVPKDTRTRAQQISLTALVGALQRDNRDITRISGHNEYANKACPSFDVSKEFYSGPQDKPDEQDRPGETQEEVHKEPDRPKFVAGLVYYWLRNLFRSK